MGEGGVQVKVAPLTGNTVLLRVQVLVTAVPAVVALQSVVVVRLA